MDSRQAIRHLCALGITIIRAIIVILAHVGVVLDGSQKHLHIHHPSRSRRGPGDARGRHDGFHLKKRQETPGAERRPYTCPGWGPGTGDPGPLPAHPLGPPPLPGP